MMLQWRDFDIERNYSMINPPGPNLVSLKARNKITLTGMHVSHWRKFLVI